MSYEETLMSESEGEPYEEGRGGAGRSAGLWALSSLHPHPPPPFPTPGQSPQIGTLHFCRGLLAPGNRAVVESGCTCPGWAGDLAGGYSGEKGQVRKEATCTEWNKSSHGYLLPADPVFSPMLFYFIFICYFLIKLNLI